MESEILVEKMKHLHFLGMCRAFETTLEAGRNQNYTQDEMINYLLDAEVDERHTRKIERLVRMARFRYKACIEDLAYDEKRNLDKNQTCGLQAVILSEKMKTLSSPVLLVLGKVLWHQLSGIRPVSKNLKFSM